MLTDASARGLGALFSLAVPPACLICGRPSAQGHRDLCGPCLVRTGTLEPVIEAGPGGVSSVVVAGTYEGISGEIVKTLKFRRHLAAAGVAASLLERAITLASPGFLRERPTVVPVPPDPLRWFIRGFDPTEEIAIALAERMSLPYSRLLVRRQGPRQTGRGRADRLARPPVVALAEPDATLPNRFLLVDDVLTTGATLTASAAPLLRGGASGVDAVCLARAGNRG